MGGTTCVKEYLYNVAAYNGASNIIDFSENGDASKKFGLHIIRNSELMPL